MDDPADDVPPAEEKPARVKQTDRRPLTEIQAELRAETADRVRGRKRRQV